MHCLGKNLLICLVAQVGNESALLGAQEVAGSAYVEVLHRNVHAAAKLAETFYSFQSASCIGGQALARRGEHIAECLALATSHTSAHLVKVTQSEVLCLVYYYGVYIGYVNAVLHNGGGYEYVVVVIDELI